MLYSQQAQTKKNNKQFSTHHLLNEMNEREPLS